jgi:peptide/nickel transport system permease protein
LFFGSVLGTSRATRLLYGSIAAAIAAAILVALITTGWFEDPGLGPVVIVAGAVAISFGVTVLLVGAENRRVLAIGLTTVAIGLGVALAAEPTLANPTWGTLIGIGALVIAAGVVLALVFGGIDRRPAIQVAVWSALGVGSLVFVDRTLSSFAAYSVSVGGRPVATIGNKTPNYSGTFWEVTLDTLTHLVLPTLAILLISFAAYSRFSRASMLETMNADYIRTARAKGVNERTVVLRHAFRNALIPIATLAALDFGAVFGGAIITETVFGWQGMGQLFNQALPNFDINQVMGFFVVTAVAVLIFNLLADLSYAFLDPRVRLS